MIRSVPLLTQLFAALLLSSVAVDASGQALIGGGRAAGMGNATTALRADAWATSNPASTGTLSGRAVSLFASQSYGLSELQYSSFQYVEPLRFGSVSAGVSSFGFTDFRDTRVGLGFARGFTFGSRRKVYLGVHVFLSQLAITGYGSSSSAGLTFGGLVELNPTLDLGFAAENINSPKVGTQDDLPRSLAVGVNYRPADSFSLVADVRQEIDSPLSVRAGLELHPADALFLRAGAGTHPTRFTGGMGVQLGLLAVDIAAQRHDVLGWTPAGGLSILW